MRVDQFKQLEEVARKHQILYLFLSMVEYLVDANLPMDAIVQEITTLAKKTRRDLEADLTGNAR